MARNCGCGGASCGCNIVNGNGITVSGIGTATDPFFISANLGELAEALSFTDSASINFTVVGTGSPSDPMAVTAVIIPQPFTVYTTGGRPSAAAAGEGSFYYDSVLNKPAWSDGAVWRDAAGVAI